MKSEKLNESFSNFQSEVVPKEDIMLKKFLMIKGEGFKGRRKKILIPSPFSIMDNLSCSIFVLSWQVGIEGVRK
tara:strand:- start:1454 stop:1675 length:222 start_codon:yes stop_codon:yes gene_type:complete